MNQILEFESNNQSGPRKPGGSDNIVRVFAIILIIFAVALLAVVGLNMMRNKQDVQITQGQTTYAEISVEVDGDQATIKANHDKNIQKLIYSWNDKSERTIVSEGKFIEETIDVPFGDNTLHIKVIDEVGVETTHDEQVFSEQGGDIISPEIKLSPLEGNKWQITATDETALDFITYRWNEDDEQTIYAEEGSKEIITEVEILKGENDLSIVAVDANNNTSTEIKTFKGLTKPEIVVTLSPDGSRIDIKATHDNGIESVAFKFNDVDYDVDIGEGTPTTIEFYQNLEVGYNRIIVTVKSVDGTETVFDGQCSYGEETEENTTENTTSNETAENTTSNETENTTSEE